MGDNKGLQMGKQTIIFNKPIYIVDGATVVGNKEGQGPLGKCFDVVVEDDFCGKGTWEEAESELQFKAVDKLLQKTELSKDVIRYIFAGDLLGQLIATSFGLMKLELPVFGVYGACSTMGETIALASMCVHGGFADKCISVASSHFASAEKQFRYPLEYGNQRPPASTWTVTGAGAYLISKDAPNYSDNHYPVIVRGVCTGKIVDFGVKDSMNMGACMAPAAADLIAACFKDLEKEPDYFDKIITGDLGYVGQELLIALLKEEGYDISKVHTDCGIEIFDRDTQNTGAGGSGCGCSAVVLGAYILEMLADKSWNRVLFVPTGALLSTVSFNEGKSVPGIAHGIILERADVNGL